MRVAQVAAESFLHNKSVALAWVAHKNTNCPRIWYPDSGVFLFAGGGFKLTPLYDAKQLQRKSMKLAIPVGNNRHYRVHDIYPRHFYPSAKAAGVSESTVTAALDCMYRKLPNAIDFACASLPVGFPENLRDSVVVGAMHRRKLIASAV